MKKRLFLILSACLLLCTWLQSRLHADILDSFEFSECCGSLAWDNGTLWCSTNTQMLNLDTSGNIIKSFDLPYDYIYGWPFAFDGQYFWVAENKYGNILKIDNQGNTLYSFKYLNRPAWATGLTWDGQYLWMVNDYNHAIERYDTTGNPVTTIKTPGRNERGITFDGEYLWVGDYPNIYKMDLSGNVFFVLYYPEGSQAGLAHDGKYLWANVCTDNQIKISKLDADRQTGTYEHFRWAFHTGSDVDAAPAIGSDGTIYVESDNSSLYAINPDGTLKWIFKTQGCCISSSPAIAPDGTVYIIRHWDSTLYALNPDGTVKWSYKLPSRFDNVSDFLAIGADGTLYVTSLSVGDTYRLFAFNPDGTPKWGARGPAFMGLAIGIEGTLYAGTSEGYLYAIDPAGASNWRVQTDGTLDHPLAIGSDGTIYLVSANRSKGYLYSISPCGVVNWRLQSIRYTYAPPVIGEDGTIYTGSQDILYAINPDGTEKWSVNVGGGVSSLPAVGRDGTIFAAVNIAYMEKKLMAVSPEGKIQWTFNAGDTISSSPAIAPDGTVYVGSNDGNLYALNTDCGGLAESSWPMYQQNPLHTGRTVVEAPMPDCSKCLAESVLGEDSKAVDDLRSFRDRVLVKTVFGNKLIELYYSNADIVTSFLDRHPVFKESARKVLQYALFVVRGS